MRSIYRSFLNLTGYLKHGFIPSEHHLRLEWGGLNGLAKNNDFHFQDSTSPVAYPISITYWFNLCQVFLFCYVTLDVYGLFIFFFILMLAKYVKYCQMGFIALPLLVVDSVTAANPHDFKDNYYSFERNSFA